jgi:hypothetical protein
LKDKSENLEVNEKNGKREQSTSKEPANNMVEENSNDTEYKPKMRKKKGTVTLEVPRNILADLEVTAMLDRTKLTNRVTTGVVASVLKAAGGDLNDFVISKDTVSRERNKKREVIAAKVKSEFEAKKPKFGC